MKGIKILLRCIYETLILLIVCYPIGYLLRKNLSFNIYMFIYVPFVFVVFNILRKIGIITGISFSERRPTMTKDKRIAELEREVEILKTDLSNEREFNAKAYYDMHIHIRHEICEEIRDKCVYVEGTKRLCENTSISTHNLNEILNQIERGDE